MGPGKDEAKTRIPLHLSVTEQLFSNGHSFAIGGSFKSLVISSCPVTTRVQVEHTVDDYLDNSRSAD